jgi:hypothetical protein
MKVFLKMQYKGPLFVPDGQLRPDHGGVRKQDRPFAHLKAL